MIELPRCVLRFICAREGTQAVFAEHQCFFVCEYILCECGSSVSGRVQTFAQLFIVREVLLRNGDQREVELRGCQQKNKNGDPTK